MLLLKDNIVWVKVLGAKHLMQNEDKQTNKYKYIALPCDDRGLYGGSVQLQLKSNIEM